MKVHKEQTAVSQLFAQSLSYSYRSLNILNFNVEFIIMLICKRTFIAYMFKWCKQIIWVPTLLYPVCASSGCLVHIPEQTQLLILHRKEWYLSAFLRVGSLVQVNLHAAANKFIWHMVYDLLDVNVCCKTNDGWSKRTSYLTRFPVGLEIIYPVKCWQIHF